MKTTRLLLIFIMFANGLFAQQQLINIGSAPNDKTGDPLRTAFDKCNDNFTELYDTAAVHRTAINLNTAKVSFPGFGTSHVLAAYGDHNHSGTYLTVVDTSGTPKVASTYWTTLLINSLNTWPEDSSNYASKSMVNDTAASLRADLGQVYTASNGLTMSGNDIRLGNAFSDNINIETSSNNSFEIVSTGTKLYDVNLDSMEFGILTGINAGGFVAVNGYNGTTIDDPYPSLNLEATGKNSSNTLKFRQDSAFIKIIKNETDTLFVLSEQGIESRTDTSSHNDSTLVIFRKLKDEINAITFNLNLVSDTSRTWTDTLKHDKLNIYYATSTSFDTLKADTVIKIKSGGIPGAVEIKEWVGDGSHSPDFVTSGIGVTSGTYDDTLGTRNQLIFLRRHKNAVSVAITQL